MKEENEQSTHQHQIKEKEVEEKKTKKNEEEKSGPIHRHPRQQQVHGAGQRSREGIAAGGRGGIIITGRDPRQHSDDPTGLRCHTSGSGYPTKVRSARRWVGCWKRFREPRGVEKRREREIDK